MKPLLLFTGPEGSGKTTLALNFKSRLESNGYRVRIVRIRGTHTFAFLLAMFLKKCLKLHGSELHYYQVRIPKRLEKFWPFLEFISILPLILFYYHFYRIWQVVISERSLVDVIVWILGGLNEKSLIIKSFTFRIFLTFASKYKPIYITATVHELMERKPYEKDLIFVLLPYYNALARILDLRIIDTSKCSLDDCLRSLFGFIRIFD
ncbi:MAG: hypothetical protein QXZ11_01620 [Thermoproteota archaeon]